MDILTDKYNEIYRSLREYLVPISSWIKCVSEFESCGRLKLTFKQPPDSHLNRWMVKYPYTTPVYEKMLRAKYKDPNSIDLSDVDKFTDDERNFWHEMIDIRIRRYLENGISEETLCMVDNKYDYGAFIHYNTGLIRPFKYPDTVRMDYVVIPLYMKNMLVNRFRDKYRGTEDELRYDLSYSGRHMRDYEVFTVPVVLDRWNIERRVFPMSDMMTYQSSVTKEELATTMKYVESMFEAHKKVIIMS